MSWIPKQFTDAASQLRSQMTAPQQKADETITKLVEKINTSAEVYDRRTAVLGLKGLSRDMTTQVGEQAFTALLAVLQYDAPNDAEMAKAVLETLGVLCLVPKDASKDHPALKNVDRFLETPEPFHHVLGLLSSTAPYFTRLYSVDLLRSIVEVRPTVAQPYLLSAPPPGVESLLDLLEVKSSSGINDAVRDESLSVLLGILPGNADLQKIVAFSGGFEKALGIIDAERGIDGGEVVADCAKLLSTMLRFNVSNQNLFRELSLIPALPRVLHFPTPLADGQPAPDTFALQEWTDRKLHHAGQILSVIRILIGGPGGPNQTAMARAGVTRALLELALASNAPNGLKSQALTTLTPIMLSSEPNHKLLSDLPISPLVAIQPDNQHPYGGFVHVPPRPAAVALVAAVVEGDPTAVGQGLRSRAAGVNLFEAYVTGNSEVRQAILKSMATPHDASNPEAQLTAGSIILSGLLDLPIGGQEFDPYRPLSSSLLLSHLIRHSKECKELAHAIRLPSGDGDDDDETVPLLQLIVGNLMMASREQAEAASRAAKEGTESFEEEDWTRVMVGYLVLLSTWLWDSPKSVAEFLSESANMQVLIGPITQPTGIDPLVQGLCAFLLGVCYEFNTAPGEITRATLHPILHSRIGPDQFVSRMARFRDDPRFRAVQPDSEDEDASTAATATVHDDANDDAHELWFDWSFVDFWKNSYYRIQRAIAVDPAASTADVGDDNAALAASLRDQLRVKSEEIAQLQKQLSTHTAEAAKHQEESVALAAETASLKAQVAAAGAAATEAAAAELKDVKEQLATAQAKADEGAAEAEAHAKTRAELDGASSELKLAKGSLAAARKQVDELKVAVAAAGGDEGGKKGKGKKGKGGAEDDSAAASAAAAATAAAEERIKALEAELASANAEAEKQVADAKAAATAELEAEQKKAEDAAKEQEDLLILLEELTQKRKADKKAMREKGIDVSEDEDEGDDDDDE